MMSFDRVLAIAGAELRLTRRLVRFWVFLAIAGLAALLGYLQIGVVHGLFSTYSATVAALSPRFMIGFLGLRYLLVFTVGVVFLGFDVRARDRRERMIEVLDSRPFTNVELLSGRFLALLAAGWVPLVCLTLLVDGTGALLRALQVPVGDTIEPISLLGFTLFMALPAFTFAIGLVFLLTLLVRHRLIAAVLLLAAIGGLFWAVLRLPLVYGPFFDIWGTYMADYPSDIIPGISDAVGWVQRFGVIVAGFGFLILAAAVHPRLDGGSRGGRAAVGGVLVVVALALMGVGSWWRVSDVHQLERWREVHVAHLDDAVPDVESMDAELSLEPGKRIAVTLDMRYRAPQDGPLESAVFSLNPGLQVSSLTDGNGTPLEFQHHDGLLEVMHPEPLAAGAGQQIHMLMAGSPDPLFGYLDSARVPEELTAMDGAIYLLGYLRSINDRRFVALMPGSRWLPAAGPDVRRDDLTHRTRDFFRTSLAVEAPAGWLVAGPGRREEIAGDGERARFRFAPAAPLDEVAVIASKFVSLAADVAGVHCELLLYPGHLDNINALSTAVPELRNATAELLSEAAANGLPYPYDGFTLVEVPTALRGFKGGWRLDTAMAPPSMLLLRESGFPSARFDVAFRKPERFQDREGGLPGAMKERVEQFFRNDFSGGNLFTGAARSFFFAETAATGHGSLALNFALEELASLVVTGNRGFFSAHVFDAEMGESIQNVMVSMGGGGNVADTVINALSSRPEVWDAVLDAPLADVDPREDPERTLDVLTLKAGAMAQSLYDFMGQEEMAQLLGKLRRDHAGATFDLDDFAAAAQAQGHDIATMVEDWITSSDLPAFVGVSASSYRLRDGNDGGARYQIVAEIRNDEAVPGLFRIDYRVGSEDDEERISSAPLRLDGRSAMRWGAVVSRPPQGLFVNSYLSLNRESFRIPMAAVDEQRIVERDAFEGVEEIEWMVPERAWIAVDDLDDGFEVVNGKGGNGLRLLGRDRAQELDGGLPIAHPFRLPTRWSRAESSTAWGRYRHTVAVIRAGKNGSRAIFTTQIPKAGAWDLEIHLCHKQRFRTARNWGTWKLVVRDPSDSHDAEFDAAAAPRGWNLVGSFDIGDGEVVVELGNDSSGQIVVADAIRWVPSSSRETEG